MILCAWVCILLAATPPPVVSQVYGTAAAKAPRKFRVSPPSEGLLRSHSSAMPASDTSDELANKIVGERSHH